MGLQFNNQSASLVKYFSSFLSQELNLSCYRRKTVEFCSRLSSQLILWLCLNYVLFLVILGTNRALDPLVFGDYPIEMRNILGSQMPRFSSNEKSLIKGSLDFIGVNHYTTLYVKDCSSSGCSLPGEHAIRGYLETTGFRDGIPIGDLVSSSAVPSLIFMSYWSLKCLIKSKLN